MKVLHIIHSLDPALGGPTQAVLGMVKALRDQGVDVEILTTNDNGKGTFDMPLGELVIYKDVPVRFFRRFPLKFKDYTISFELIFWLWRNIRRYDLICIHYIFSFTSTCAAFVSFIRKVPYIIRTLGQLTPWALAQSKLRKQIYLILFDKHILRNATFIHCTSCGEMKDVRALGLKTPIFVLPLGVKIPELVRFAKDKLCLKYGIPLNRALVLFLSRLHQKKRLELVIFSLKKLISQGLNLHLVIAGSGREQYVVQLKKMVTELGLESYVSFLGFISGEDKDILFQGSDIFVLPSFSENFGVVVAEAMSVGLPVIISKDIQIANEIQENHAGVVIENNLESLSEALRNLLSSPELRKTLGLNAKSLVAEQYSWERIAKELELIYYKSKIDSSGSKM